MNKRSLILLLVLAGGCHAELHTEQYPFSFAPQGEAKFFDRCIQDAKECRWLRFNQNEGGEGYTSTDSYSFPASAEFAETKISMPCKRMVGSKAWISNASNTKIQELLPKQVTNEPDGICELNIPVFDAVANAKGFNFLRIEQVVSTKRDPVSVNIVYRFAGKVRTKVILQSASDSTLFLESNRAKGTSSHGYHEIKNGNGTILEFESALGSDSYLGISSQKNWVDINKIYKTKAAVGVVGSITQGKLDEALSRYAQLGLTYINDTYNAGFVPRLGYSEVLAKGRGDCKDMVVVMMRELAEIGIEAQPVLMGTQNGIAVPPTLKVLPDLSWASHVILYLPNQNKFIDPTLSKGHYVVDVDYQWYGAVGVDLETEKRVFVGQ